MDLCLQHAFDSNAVCRSKQTATRFNIVNFLCLLWLPLKGLGLLHNFRCAELINFYFLLFTAFFGFFLSRIAEILKCYSVLQWKWKTSLELSASMESVASVQQNSKTKRCKLNGIEVNICTATHCYDFYFYFCCFVLFGALNLLWMLVGIPTWLLIAVPHKQTPQMPFTQNDSLTMFSTINESCLLSHEFIFNI